MKRNVLSLLIPALLVAGSVHAAEIYNQNGNKLDLYGQIHGLHYFASSDSGDSDSGDSDSGDNGDQTYARLGINGLVQISDQLTGYGTWEENFDAMHEEDGNAATTRLAFAGLKFANIGTLDYGRNDGAVYDITAWTDVLPEFGGDTYSADNFMQSRANGMLTYRNSDFFGLVTGLNFALQYQGANKYDSANESNGDGFAASVSYESPIKLSIGGALSTSKRTDKQDLLTYGKGDRAETYSVGVKYDDHNIYIGAHYKQTYNATFINDGSKGFANKADNLEIVAQYAFDFGLKPSVAYLQSTGHDIETYGDQDLLKYVEVGLNHDFNQNMSAYVDYKINLLKDNAFTKVTGIKTDNIVALGVVYQF